MDLKYKKWLIVAERRDDGFEVIESGSDFYSWYASLQEARAAHPDARESSWIAVVEKGAVRCPPHEWDRDGERCVKCGDKDWMT